MSRVISIWVGLRQYRVEIVDQPVCATADLATARVTISDKARLVDLLEVIELCRDHEYPPVPPMIDHSAADDARL